MKTKLQRLFLQEVQKNFGFLEPKFKGPFIEEGYCSTTVVYLGDNLAIEFVLDEREDDLSCYVARVIDGKRPRGFIDSRGQRVRGLLRSLLRGHRVEENLSIPMNGLSLKERIPVTLSGLAYILQQHGRRILDDDPGFLDIPSVPQP